MGCLLIELVISRWQVMLVLCLILHPSISPLLILVYVSTLLTVPRSLYSFVHVSTSQSAQKSLQTYMYMYVYDPPEPVCDLTMISRPLSRWGIARCWTVVICVIWNLSSRFVIWKHIHGRETPSLVYAYNSILVVGSFY